MAQKPRNDAESFKAMLQRTGRILTQRANKNPDMWPDVRRHLPLLTKPDVAAQFKLGPCRCNMPVDYVESVRAYYDVLLRLEPPYQPKLRAG